MALTLLTHASPSAPALTGVAGSLISVLDYCLVSVMGWTRLADSTSTIAAYRQPAGTNQFYLRVDNTNTTYARVRMYETLTATPAGTGTNPVPSDAQLSGGAIWGTSTAAGTTARPWFFVSDGKMFHLVIGLTSAAPTWGGYNTCYTFGDFPSYKSGDVYNTLITSDANLAPANSPSHCSVAQAPSANVTSAVLGHYTMRPHTQLSTGIAASRIADMAGAGAMSFFGGGAVSFPAPISGGIELARVYIGEGQGRRGRLPGMWCWQHPASSPINDADTFTGAAGMELAGRSFVFFRVGGTNQGVVILETSDTWSS